MFLVRMFAISYIVTVVTEEVVAFLWGYRNRHDILTVLWVNTVTNPCAVGLRYVSAQLILSQTGRNFAVLGIEVMVLLAEWLLFRRFLSKGKYFFLFSLVMNGASYGVGLLVPLLLTFLARILERRLF